MNSLWLHNSPTRPHHQEQQQAPRQLGNIAPESHTPARSGSRLDKRAQRHTAQPCLNAGSPNNPIPPLTPACQTHHPPAQHPNAQYAKRQQVNLPCSLDMCW
ncbi:hypothetical protein ILYODFUR_010457 [Ilyodon furcidens]|uniref:Uncharacterized protein n=1 Tax=Ilyodon furcidens TaxID=33524 RepID=A0ABV0U626_9TELE